MSYSVIDGLVFILFRLFISNVHGKHRFPIFEQQQQQRQQQQQQDL